jgi:hypothetical protein
MGARYICPKGWSDLKPICKNEDDSNLYISQALTSIITLAMVGLLKLLGFSPTNDKG